VRAIGSGDKLFATGRDPFVPTRNGHEPATGAILAAIETASGATATITGKPEPHIFAIARHLLPGCKRVAMIGDNLATDIAGAKRAGLDAILVLSGATDPVELKQATARPDLVLPSLAALG
jgi:4-nitrophenyl phosphatase